MTPTIFDPNQQLRALSWKQPFAELMTYGKIETRTWATSYRGWVLICASKTPYSWYQLSSITDSRQLARITDLLSLSIQRMEQMPVGVAIAVGQLVDCRRMTPQDEDACFVEWWEDLYCHIYANVREIEPIPWKGTQGWKEVPMEIKQQIKFIK